MKNPFFMINVRSERAIRFAVGSSVAAAIITPIAFYLSACFNTDFDLRGADIPVLVVGVMFAPFSFVVVGYVVIGFAWVVEFIRRRNPK